jgi:heptaprenyl diphosphate synthase
LTPLPGEAPSSLPASGPRKDGDNRSLALPGALCLFLSTLEYLIPKPLPFIRIGLANLPLLLVLDITSPRRFALLALIKIAGAGIVGGTIFSYVFLFSLGGGLASALAMYGLGLLRRTAPEALRPSLAGVGAAGALCSTAVQLLLARFLVFGGGIRYLIPPFLAAALVTGFALGLFCEYFRRRSRWYALYAAGGPAVQDPQPAARPGPPSASPAGGEPRDLRRRRRRERWDSLFDHRELALAGFLAALLFLFNPSALGRGLQFLLFCFFAWASGKKNRPLLSLLVIAAVVLVNLLAPYGRVLAEIGPLSVTAGSLAGGIRKGITLEGLIMLSGAAVRGGARRKSPGAAPGKGIRGGGFAAFRGLLGESLAVFAALSEEGGHVRPGHLAEDIDRLLLERGGPGACPGGPDREIPPQAPTPEFRRGPAGRGLLVLGLLAAAALTVLPALSGL